MPFCASVRQDLPAAAIGEKTLEDDGCKLILKGAQTCITAKLDEWDQTQQMADFLVVADCKKKLIAFVEMKSGSIRPAEVETQLRNAVRKIEGWAQQNAESVAGIRAFALGLGKFSKVDHDLILQGLKNLHIFGRRVPFTSRQCGSKLVDILTALAI